MNNNALISLCFILFTLSSSCLKRDFNDGEVIVEEHTSQIELVQALYGEQHNGVLQILHDLGDGYSSDDVYALRLAGDDESIFRPHRNVEINNIISINTTEEISVYQDSDDVSKLYGANLSIDLTKEGGEKNRLVDDIYIPKSLKSNINDLPETFGRQSLLNWEPDANSNGGVYVVVDYSPYLNSGEIANSFPNSIMEYVGLDDIGSFVYTPGQFSRIPSGAKITVTLIRGVALSMFFEGSSGSDVVLAYSTNSRIFLSP